MIIRRSRCFLTFGSLNSGLQGLLGPVSKVMKEKKPQVFSCIERRRKCRCFPAYRK